MKTYGSGRLAELCSCSLEHIVTIHIRHCLWKFWYCCVQLLDDAGCSATAMKAGLMCLVLAELVFAHCVMPCACNN